MRISARIRLLRGDEKDMDRQKLRFCSSHDGERYEFPRLSDSGEICLWAGLRELWPAGKRRDRAAHRGGRF